MREMSVEAAEATVLAFEKMLLETYIEKAAEGAVAAELAINGLAHAYEMALHMRYPFKVRRP